jgi:hypothetical protein
MKEKIFSMAAITLGLTLIPSVYAVSSGNARRQELNEIKETRQEITSTRKMEMNNFLELVREKIASKVGEFGKIARKRAFINKAKITVKGDSSLSVEKDGKTYTVNVDSNTKIRRRFYGDAAFSDLLVGHEVDIVGKWTDDTKTTILASLIRDISIQKRHGVFIGIVQAISGNDITIKTVNRGIQKATVTSSTVYVNRMQQKINLSDIAVGHRIRVKGMWDNTFNTITDVTHVKDFTLPLRPNITPKPTEKDDDNHPNVTPTVTSTPAPTASPTPAPTATPTPFPTV